MKPTSRLNQQDPGQYYEADLSSEPAGSRTLTRSLAPESLSRCRLCPSPLGKKNSRRVSIHGLLSMSPSLTGDTLDLLRLSDSLEISLSPNDLSRGHDTGHCLFIRRS